MDPDFNVSGVMCDEPYESGIHHRGVDQELPPFPFSSVRRFDYDDGHFIGVGQPRGVRRQCCDVLGHSVVMSWDM